MTDLERISDHAVNIAELAQELAQKKVEFSPRASQELQICLDAVLEISELACGAMMNGDLTMARLVEPLEEVIDALAKDLKLRHIQRVQAGQCTLEMGFVFNDCVNNFERIADHCSNLAIAVLEEAGVQLKPHDYLFSLEENDQQVFRARMMVYAKKYYEALDQTE